MEGVGPRARPLERDIAQTTFTYERFPKLTPTPLKVSFCGVSKSKNIFL